MTTRVGDCDVIQVSCHGAMGQHPVLALEGKLGARVDVTAGDLWAAFGTKPRLMFLSACSTAGAGLEAAPGPDRDINAQVASLGSTMLWPLASDLCRRGWPAVLGWSCAVSDLAAIELAAALYRQLIQRIPLVEAFGKARAALANTPSGAAWHKARLFLGPAGGGKIIDSTRPRPNQGDLVRTEAYLDPATRKIPVAGPDEPFRYRRAFQEVIATLRESNDSGVVVHGEDMLVLATFAARVVRHMDRDLKRLVVANQFEAPAILQQIRDQTALGEVNAIASRYLPALYEDPSQLLQALRAIIDGPCQSAGAGAFVLVLHGFDPIPDPNAQPDDRRNLSPERLAAARALIGAFTGARTASRLLFTSSAPFSVPADNGSDLASALHGVRLVRP